MPTPTVPSNGEQDPADATLVFHEQADGRKVSRLPGGKVVLIDLAQVDRVRDGDGWYVKLRHRETFAIADPVEKVTAAALESSASTLTSPLAEALRRARTTARPSPEPPSAPAAPAAAAPATTPALKPPVESPAEDPATSPVSVAPVAAVVQQATGTAPQMARLLRPADRVALFIDGANTDGSARAAGYFIDFRLAREHFTSSGTFYAAFYYVADFTASDPLQTRFFDFLSHAGYIVRRRPVKVIRDQVTGERIIKGNLDTEIVLDMLNTVDNYDVAFLFSGDSDFERAIDLLRSRGKRLYIVSARAQLSRELAFVADKPIFYLEDHREVLARPDR